VEGHGFSRADTSTALGYAPHGCHFRLSERDGCKIDGVWSK